MHVDHMSTQVGESAAPRSIDFVAFSTANPVLRFRRRTATLPENALGGALGRQASAVNLHASAFRQVRPNIVAVALGGLSQASRCCVAGHRFARARRGIGHICAAIGIGAAGGNVPLRDAVAFLVDRLVVAVLGQHGCGDDGCDSRRDQEGQFHRQTPDGTTLET